MRPFSNTRGAAPVRALTLALSLAAVPSTEVSAEELRFLVFGDAPYTDEQIKELKDTVAPAIQNAEFPFLIHLGDMKGGGESCTDALIQERYEQLMALLPERVFYTPGDNEWTDCDRPSLDQRYPELERLDHLRDLIVSWPMILRADWEYATQLEYPENARWTQGNVIFATVHIVSTNNGREEIFLDDIETTLDLVDARDRANLDWLRAAFEKARNLGSYGASADAVVIATHVDVSKLESKNREPCSAAVRIRCDAFAAFRDQLLRLAADFKKPVLLIHGDTNPFCLDKKFGGNTAPLLWRLNALGDYTAPLPWRLNALGYYSEVDATVISFNPFDPEQPFEITSLTSKTWPNETCP